jgi:hypothetical protein
VRADDGARMQDVFDALDHLQANRLEPATLEPIEP